MASWRDVLPIHPAADLFPLMIPGELKVLGEDIKKNGLTSPIALWQADFKSPTCLVDGRNRLDGIETTGRQVRAELAGATKTGERWAIWIDDKRISNSVIVLPPSVDPYAYVISANIHRRHLSIEDKDRLIVKVLQADPTKSNRQVAKMVKASHPHVAKVREQAEKTGDVETVTTSIDSKGRQQPAKRKPAIEQQVRNYKTLCNEAEAITLKNYLGEDVLYPKPKGKATFNETNDQVSWAAWTWNPVTGCLHNCEYCYAREGAVNNPNLSKFYPVGFTPLFHHDRLDAPANTKVPKEAAQDSRLGRVFVVSMGDLYGKWVPDEWIGQVHAKMLANQQWEYLMLTKFPQRYVGLQFPPTAWLGTTVDEQYRVKIAEEAFRKISGVRVKWLSLEPLRQPLEFTDMSMFDWVVIGAQSATEQPGIGRVPEFSPPFEWVMRIVAQAREAGCRIYMKPNLLGDCHPQSPGMKLIQEQPACFDPLPDSDDGFDIPASLRDCHGDEVPPSDSEWPDIPDFLRRDAS